VQERPRASRLSNGTLGIRVLSQPSRLTNWTALVTARDGACHRPNLIVFSLCQMNMKLPAHVANRTVGPGGTQDTVGPGCPHVDMIRPAAPRGQVRGPEL